MATVGTGNLTAHRGDTWVLDFLYKDSAGAAIDLTGYKARLQVRTDYRQTPLLSLSSYVLSGYLQALTITGALGKIALNVPASNMEIPSGEYQYDIEVESASGVITTLARGSLTVTDDVTRVTG